MNNISRTVGVKRIGQFTYNAALSTAHNVTAPAVFFFKNNMLSIRGYIIDIPVTCMKQSPTRQFGPTLSLSRILTSLNQCGSHPQIPGRSLVRDVVFFPHLKRDTQRLRTCRSSLSPSHRDVLCAEGCVLWF